jgi:hypothetical protein
MIETYYKTTLFDIMALARFMESMVAHVLSLHYLITIRTKRLLINYVFQTQHIFIIFLSAVLFHRKF